MPPRSQLFLKVLLLVCCLVHPITSIRPKLRAALDKSRRRRTPNHGKARGSSRQTCRLLAGSVRVEQLLKSYRFEKDGTGQRELKHARASPD